MAGPSTIVYPVGDIDYRPAINVLKDYLGKNWGEIELWMDANLGSYSDAAAADFLRSQGWEYVASESGRAYGWQQMATHQFSTAIEGAMDSNIGSSVTGKFSMVAKTNWVTDTLGRNVMTLGKGVWGTDVNKYAIGGPVGVAAGAVMAGAKLGKFISGALYQFSPDVWDEIGLGSMNPDTWASITRGDDSWNAKILNFILGIDGDTGETTGYMDENALAYYAQYLALMGAFAVANMGTATSELTTNITQPIKFLPAGIPIEFVDDRYGDHHKWMFGADAIFSKTSATGTGVSANLASKTSPIKVYRKTWRTSWGQTEPAQWSEYNYNTSSYDYNGNTVYYSQQSGIDNDYSDILGTLKNDYVGTADRYSAWTVEFGNTSMPSGVEGITPQPNSSNPDTTGWDNPQDTLASLKQQYPGWWDEAITNTTANPDGTVTTTTYVPVPLIDGMFNSVNDYQPTNTTQISTDTKVNPDTSPQKLQDIVTEILINTQPKTDPETQPDTDTPTPVPNPPVTGDGDTPQTPIPTGTANALYAIYNPSQAELNSLGAWLWSPDFVDQLLKLFNDPMQAIIGLHKVFATPSIGGRQNIKVGYLDSGVASNVVNSQYVTVDCGTVSLPEYFGNVFDYAPYTDVSIYLPFIGIQKLDVADIMRSTIGVVYHVDVLTGACLAEINVTRDASGGVLYTFSGNCAVQYPLSSGSYMGIISTVASVATSAIGGFATGGIGGAALGAGMAAIHGSGARISHSGSLSGNSGAMGGKIPYLIISRPQTTLASTFPNQQGYPTNYSATLGEYTGFVQCSAMHVESTCATQAEISEIQSLLRDGVMV